MRESEVYLKRYATGILLPCEVDACDRTFAGGAFKGDWNRNA